MEAVATQNLWIWHPYAGIPGSNNDINIVDRLPLVVNWLQGTAPSYEYAVNGHQYKNAPQTEQDKRYAKKQEAVRKDVERSFGVLQARFAILVHPGRYWDLQMLQTVWHAAMIMHNMIIEDEEKGIEQDTHSNAASITSTGSSVLTFDALLLEMARVQDENIHLALRNDLVAHLWSQKATD